MTPREVYRYKLLNYPTMYSGPLEISCNLFMRYGHGYRWHKGNLVNVCPREKEDGPEFEDHSLDIDLAVHPYMQHLAAERHLEYKSQVLMYEFIRDNIELVLDSGPCATFFMNDYQVFAWHLRSQSLDYATGVNFPEDITPEWAEYLYKFLVEWQQGMRSIYMFSDRGDGTEHWPEKARADYRRLKETQVRLYPYAHEGRDFETDMKEQGRLADQIINEILAEEKANGRR